MKVTSKCFGLAAGLSLLVVGLGLPKSVGRRVEPGAVAGEPMGAPALLSTALAVPM